MKRWMILLAGLSLTLAAVGAVTAFALTDDGDGMPKLDVVVSDQSPLTSQTTAGRGPRVAWPAPRFLAEPAARVEAK